MLPQKRNYIALFLCWVFVAPQAADAADGFMIRVTADRAPIQVGTKTLATVTKGTRLWAFEVRDGEWVRVKVPRQEQKGWLHRRNFEPIELTAYQKARLETAYAHDDRYSELRDQNRTIEAIAELKSALSIVREVFGNDHPLVAIDLHSLGLRYKNLKDYSVARRYYEEALNIKQKTLGNEHTSTALTLNSMGGLFKELGDHATARKHYEAALATRRKVLGNDHIDTASTLNSLGNLIADLGDHSTAQRILEEALAIKRKVHGSEHSSTAMTLNNLGQLFQDLGDYRAARNHYEESLAIKRKLFGDDHIETASALSNLGNLFRDLDNYAEARRYHEQVLAIRRKVLGNDHIDTADTIHNLGRLASDQGDYIAAKELYTYALNIFRAVLGDRHIDTADTLNNLGVLESKLGHNSAARTYYEEALAIRRQFLGNEHIDTASTLQNLGSLAFDLGDYSAARHHYEETIPIFRNVLGNEHPATATALRNLGAVYYYLDDYPLARKYFEEALAIHRQVLGNNHTSTATSLHSLGALFSEMEDYPAARRHYDEALAIKRNVLGNEHIDTASTLNNLGMMSSDLGDNRAARGYYDEALDIYRNVLGDQHPKTAFSLQLLAWLEIKSDRPMAATDYFEESRRIISRYESRTLPTLSNSERLSFLENNHQSEWAECLSFGLINANDQAIAIQSVGWLINGKAITQQTSSEAAALAKPELQPLVQQLRSVRGQLAKLALQETSDSRQRQMAKLEAEQQRLVRELGRARGKDLTADPWVSTDQLRGAIPAGSVLVNIVAFRPYDFEAKKRGAAHYVAWLISPADGSATNIIDLGEAAPIDDSVAKFRDAMRDAPANIDEQGEQQATADIKLALAELSRLVWQPLADTVGDAQELILSPDSALWLVPWAALPIEQDQYLIEKYRMRYVISGRELVQERDETEQTGQAAIFADPDYDLRLDGSASREAGSTTLLAQRSTDLRGTVQRLPGTAIEAHSIAPSVEKIIGRKPSMYLGDKATEARFRDLEHPRVLSIGTHGFFLEAQEVEIGDDADRLMRDESSRPALTTDGKLVEDPLLRCGLMLAGANRRDQSTEAARDDGVLTGLEIVGADLQGTELVVLSACDTGIGSVRTGEGVAGLRQAFQFAGAESVVATLWQISDDETIRLMNDFFGFMSIGRSKAGALREAQLRRIAAHREESDAAHPYFWAAFTITGAE